MKLFDFTEGRPDTHKMLFCKYSQFYKRMSLKVISLSILTLTDYIDT